MTQYIRMWQDVREFVAMLDLPASPPVGEDKPAAPTGEREMEADGIEAINFYYNS